MRNGLIGGAVLASLAACSSPAEMGDDIGIAAAAAATSASAAATASKRATATSQTAPDAAGTGYRFEDTEEKNGAERRFLYTWPKEVAAIPALTEIMLDQRSTQLAEQKELWAAMIATCPPEATSCRTATYESEWSVVADTDRFFSLSSSIYTYTGGAHGNFGRGSIIWDREAGQSIAPIDFFVSPAALSDVIGKQTCARLNAERAQRRGQPVPPGATDWPDQCVDITDAVIFLGSSTGTKFNRLGIYYAPYVAGSYAEGDYELTLPVTEAVIAAVKPAYRDAFAPAK